MDSLYYDSHTHQSEGGGVRMIDTPLGQGSPVRFEQGKFYSLSFHPRRLEQETWSGVSGSFVKCLEEGAYAAIGEVGLDRLVAVSSEVQEQCLEEIIGYSERFRLPLILHCVGRYDRLIALAKKRRITQPWVLHGYRGNPSLTKQLLRFANFYFSIGYHFAEESLRMIPVDRLLVETDDADRTIEVVCGRVAAVKAVEETVFAGVIERTFLSLFGN